MKISSGTKFREPQASPEGMRIKDDTHKVGHRQALIIEKASHVSVGLFL